MGALTVAAACTDGGLLAPPEAFPVAVVQDGCAPADGGALFLYLSPDGDGRTLPTAPFVRVGIWRPGAYAQGVWTLAGAGADGEAVLERAEGGALEFAERGEVAVRSIADDGTVRGHLDLRFPSGVRVRGGFTAAKVPSMIVGPRCG